jgi:hypothetical protein
MAADDRRRRIVAGAAYWVQWDWGSGPTIAGRATLLFCAWLACSRFRVVIPTWDRTMTTLIGCRDRSLRSFGSTRVCGERHRPRWRRGRGPRAVHRRAPPDDRRDTPAHRRRRTEPLAGQLLAVEHALDEAARLLAEVEIGAAIEAET